MAAHYRACASLHARVNVTHDDDTTRRVLEVVERGGGGKAATLPLSRSQAHAPAGPDGLVAEAVPAAHDPPAREHHAALDDKEAVRVVVRLDDVLQRREQPLVQLQGQRNIKLVGQRRLPEQPHALQPARVHLGGFRAGAGGFRDEAGGFRDGAGRFRDGAGGFRDGAGGFRDGAGGFRDGAGGFRDGAGGLRDGTGGFRARVGSLIK
eukprot:1186188-Prorocentrum_minimum.AAC.1